MRSAAVVPACLAIAAAALAVPGAGGARPRLTIRSDSVTIDHVILAINDLDAGIAEFERRTGVRATVGGAHPGRGTRNALASLGNGRYLEILAPNPADAGGAAAASELAPYRHLTPYGWAVRVTNADAAHRAIAARGVMLGPVRPGARDTPDGRRLAWKTFSPGDTTESLLPFFIAWDATSAHPSTTAPGGCTLHALELAHPAPDDLRATLAAMDAVVPTSRAPVPRLRLTLDCPRGRVAFE